MAQIYINGLAKSIQKGFSEVLRKNFLEIVNDRYYRNPSTEKKKKKKAIFGSSKDLIQLEDLQK